MTYREREESDAAMDKIGEIDRQAQSIVDLELEKAELLARAWKFDDKPHLLYSHIAEMAKGHPEEREIRRLMNRAYKACGGKDGE